MNNYPFHQAAKSQQKPAIGSRQNQTGKPLSRNIFSDANAFFKPNSTLIGAQSEVPFGQVNSSGNSSAQSSLKMQSSQISSRLASTTFAQSSRFPGIGASHQNGALLATSQNQMARSNYQSASSSSLVPSGHKINYQDNFKSVQERRAAQAYKFTAPPQTTQSKPSIVQSHADQLLSNTQAGAAPTRDRQLYERLMEQAGDIDFEAHVEKRQSSSGGDLQEVTQVAHNASLMRYLNRGKTQTQARQVYASGQGMRQLNAMQKPNLLQAKAATGFRMGSGLNYAGETGKTVMKQSAVTGRTNEVIMEGGKEMIELACESDDDMEIDMADIEAAINAPGSPVASKQASKVQPIVNYRQNALLQSRNNSSASLRYGQFFDQDRSRITNRNFQTKVGNQSSSLSAISKLKNLQKPSKPIPVPLKAPVNPNVPDRRSYTSSSSMRPSGSKGSAILGDPLSCNNYMPDISTKRLLERKKREVEAQKKEQQDLEEKAELQKKVARLKREAERRKRKQAKKSDDALYSVLGIETKSDSKKGKERDLDFIENDIGKGLAALLDDKCDAGPSSAQREDLEAARNAEQSDMMRRREDQERREQEAREKMIRFHNRNRIDELIQPILSLELIRQFHEADPKGLELSEIPTTFASHVEYMDSWIPLFLFETYNQIISQKGASMHDRELAELLGVNSDRLNREFNFPAVIEKVKVDFEYVHLRVLEAENLNGVPDPRGFQSFPMLQKLRENDLVLISESPLEGVSSKPVKRICDAEFLMQMVNKEKSGIFLGCVSSSRAKDTNFVDVRVDAGFVEQYFALNQHALFSQQKRLHCYYFDSLTTIVREFLTIKKIEFYATHDIIMNPVQAMLKIEAQAAVQDGAEEHKANRDRLEREGKDEMKLFIKRHGPSFNESQLEALQKVADMRKKDLLLIQGPPGTGKTHTIHGIISMINSCRERKILVCAPSNAAIDEIVTRLTRDKFSTQTRDVVLRVGSMDYDPNDQVKRHSLDYKLDLLIQKQQLAKSQQVSSTASPRSAPHGAFQGSQRQPIPKFEPIKINSQKEKLKALDAVKTAMTLLRDQRHDNENLKAAVKSVFGQPSQFQDFLDIAKRTDKIDALEAMRKMVDPPPPSQVNHMVPMGNLKPISYAQRQKLVQKVLKEARIVCTTLSMSASDMFNNFSLGDFEYLIVDEACQSVELNNLIPFQHEPKKVILVGDQKQLPATVFSGNGEQTRYSRSMFERFLECGVKTYMLQIQYRMHPCIRQFPSDQFYAGKLRDDESVVARQLDPTLAKAQAALNLHQVIFFDLAYSYESQAETSKQNPHEVNLIRELLFVLAKHVSGSKYKQTDLSPLKGKIGIISPYKSQVRQIKMALARVRGKLNIEERDIEVNTVDAYQGREKDIIIISTVRTHGLGFLRDFRRMNVAITRAKHFLWVIGKEKCLSQDENWRALIKNGTQKCFTMTENPIPKHHQSNERPQYERAQDFLERTLVTGKVGPLPAQGQSSQLQKAAVSYNDIFSPAQMSKPSIKCGQENSPDQNKSASSSKGGVTSPAQYSCESTLSASKLQGPSVKEPGAKTTKDSQEAYKRSYRDRSPPNQHHHNPPNSHNKESRNYGRNQNRNGQGYHSNNNNASRHHHNKSGWQRNESSRNRHHQHNDQQTHSPLPSKRQNRGRPY